MNISYTALIGALLITTAPSLKVFADAIDASSPPVAIEIVEAAPPSQMKEVEPSTKAGKIAAQLPKTAANSETSVKAKEPVLVAAPAPAVGKGISLQSAKGEKLAIAMGHYARSRALLISALREFDKGYELVDPNALVDAEGWRQGVTLRAQELARVLDPQPRTSKGGVRFDSSTAGTGDAGAFKKK